MTREEAKERIERYCGDNPIYVFVKKYISSLIDEIYDDSESRICENCEHWSEEKKQCFNEESIAFTSQEAVYYDDGCNKFVRKAKS